MTAPLFERLFLSSNLSSVSESGQKSGQLFWYIWTKEAIRTKRWTILGGQNFVHFGIS